MTMWIPLITGGCYHHHHHHLHQNKHINKQSDKNKEPRKQTNRETKKQTNATQIGLTQVNSSSKIQRPRCYLHHIDLCPTDLKINHVTVFIQKKFVLPKLSFILRKANSATYNLVWSSLLPNLTTDFDRKEINSVYDQKLVILFMFKQVWEIYWIQRSKIIYKSFKLNLDWLPFNVWWT